MKFQKKPIVVDAFQWNGETHNFEMPEWFREGLDSGIVSFENAGTDEVRMSLRTLQGVVLADPKDYIIRGLTGELYPCKPYIFEDSYAEYVEPVNTAVNTPAAQDGGQVSADALLGQVVAGDGDQVAQGQAQTPAPEASEDQVTTEAPAEPKG